MVDQALHEHAASLPATGHANRSRRLIKCAKDSGHYPRFFAVTRAQCFTQMGSVQKRRELLDFMTIDHRAAADMGVAVNDAREWAYRPFWRA